MSTQKGNATRTRSQKYQNKTVFKNNLHDTSHTIKFINSLSVENVCVRCKSVIEWKIKYKKYKPLKSPSTCVKCHGKNVKQAYHTICSDCSKKLKVCPKCGQEKELVESAADVEKLLKSPEVEEAVRNLSERKRRTFHRQINNGTSDLNTKEQIIEKIKGLSLDKRKNLDDDFDCDGSDDSEESFDF